VKPDHIDETVKTLNAAPSVDGRRCSGCGLTVPPELDTCPNDGIAVVKKPQELLPNSYEFIDLVGKGGMSVIYKARHRLMENIVAIKLLQEKLTQDKSAFLRFRQEAQASSRLNHPCIIKVLDFGVLEHGAAFLVMDYVAGRSLSEVISQDGALTPERAIPLFRQICEGLSHAHKNGVLHRDLKPSNILVMRDPEDRERVKIVDFGIAKVLAPDGAEANKLTGTGEVFGSPLYMSPEQCMGLEVDARSDIYSMGCLMYEALCGSPPLMGSNPLETIFKQMNDAPEPLTARIKHPQAGALSTVILRALEKDKAHRYQTIDALLDDLYKVERGQKIHAKRRVPYFKLAALGVVIAIGAIVYMAMHPHIPWQVQSDAKIGILKWQDDSMNDADCELLRRLNPDASRIELRANHHITTAGVSKFLQMKNVEEMLLDETGVDDQFMRNLAASPVRLTLKKIGIGRTKVTSAGLACLANFPSLVEIMLLDQKLDDAAIEKLPPIPSLQRLKVDYNPAITDPGAFAAFQKYPNLNILCVRKTHVGDEAVDAIGQLVAKTPGRVFTIQCWHSNITKEAVHRWHGHLKMNDQFFPPWWNDGDKGGFHAHSNTI
jgi:serine/threonine protein kinase